MSKVLVTESYLTDIGNAIRAKNGSTTKYKPSEMANAINGITTQGTTQDNTVLNSILDRSISGNYVNNDLTEIGDSAFTNCKNLTSATFTKATKVCANAFSSTLSLKSISLPEVKTIENQAFVWGALTSINMPKIEVLGTDDDWWGIFDYCPITTINIPSTIKSIGKNTFENTNKLTTITIDRKSDAISGSPWGATNATVSWTGSV